MINSEEQKTEVFPLFSTPIYKSFLDPISLETINFIKSANYEIPDVINVNEQTNQYGLVTSEKTIFKWKELKPLISIINKEVDYFSKEILKVENFSYYMHSCWAVKHLPNHWAFKHSHKNCIISGILYIDVHPNSGRVVFEKPLHYLNLFPSCFSASYMEINTFNCASFAIEPENNMIVLFPSHLEHYVEPNLSGKDRYCIAFDYFLKGSISA